MRGSRVGRFGCLVAAVALAASGCGGDEPVPPAPAPTEPTVPAPKVTVPRGVELTPQGTELGIGAGASAIYRADRRRTSVIDVRVQRVRQGSIARDFATFQLPDQVRRQTPYFVTVRLTNDGPGQLGGADVPVYALDSSDTYFPATTLLGTLPACPGGPLPRTFAPKDTQTSCLLFMVRPGQSLQELQLRPYEGFEPVSWTVPDRVPAAQPQRPRG